MYAVHCTEDCSDLYVGETKQSLPRRITTQHRRDTLSGQDSAVHLHLNENGHAFLDSNVHALDIEDRWSKQGWWTMTPFVYKVVLVVLPKRFNPYTHLGPCEPKVPHETRGEEQTLWRDSHLGSCYPRDSHDA